MPCMLSMLVLLAPAAAQAADKPSPEPTDGEEIVVTGERVSRTLRETPSSVEVFTADRLQATPGADRLDHILELVPNVTLGTGSLGPTIRGQDSTGALQDLPAFLGGNRSRVTLQVDGRAVGYNEFLFGAAPLWDVDQVEVFRSPQSTTQGRNSIAGAIFVTTKDPTYQWEAGARAIAGNFATSQLSAVASGPILADQLAMRVAGDLRRGRTASRITDVMAGANPNDDDFGLLRAKLLAEPRSLPGVRIEAAYSHSQSAGPQVERVTAPFAKRRDVSPGYGVFETKVDAVTIMVEADLIDTLKMRSTATGGRARAKRFPRPGLGRADNRTSDFSVESILDWRPGGSTRLTGGVHYLATRLDQAIDLTAVLGLGEFDDRQRSFGLFGEAAFEALPGLSVTAGLRYQRDGQRRQGQIGNPLFLLPMDFDGTYSAWLPKLSLAYAFAEKFTAGLLVQRAYNPGGVTLNFDTGQEDVFGAETLWAYELFTRAELAGGRLRLSANLFHTAIRNAQRATFFPYRVPGGATAFWAEIDNLPKAETHGLEATAQWRPGARFSLQAGVGLLRTEITGPLDSNPALKGNRFARSPAFTGSLAVKWRPTDRLRLDASVRHNGPYFSNDANSLDRRVGQATRIDARAAYEAGRFTIFGYARNLLDDFNMTYLFGPTTGVAMDPREIGVGLETRF